MIVLETYRTGKSKNCRRSKLTERVKEDSESDCIGVGPGSVMYFDGTLRS